MSNRVPLLLCAWLSLAACDEGKEDAKGKSDAKAVEGKSDAKAVEGKSDAKAVEGKSDAKAVANDASVDDAAAADRELIAKNGACTVEISGAVTKTVTAPGGVSALGSDYFMNDDEMREALKIFKHDVPVEDAMKADPRIYALVVNCAGEGVSLNFLPGGAGKYADIPFGPKKYTLASLSGTKDGNIGVMVSIDREPYKAKPDGYLDVTRFDAHGIQGTFEFGASGKAGDVTIKGKIDYRCAQPTAACRAAGGG